MTHNSRRKVASTQPSANSTPKIVNKRHNSKAMVPTRKPTSKRRSTSVVLANDKSGDPMTWMEAVVAIFTGVVLPTVDVYSDLAFATQLLTEKDWPCIPEWEQQKYVS